MSPGHGCDYLLKSVVVGDGNRALRTPMTRYYAEAGTPPGVWLGSGVREFGAGQLTAGAEVTPSQLELLLVHGRDPITGEQLGRGYPTYPSIQERIDKRIAGLDATLTTEARADAVARITHEEERAGPEDRGVWLRPDVQRPQVSLGAVGARGR
ncbi:MAG: relaxase domain-containing protein [Marmoricola sp.]